MKTDQEEPKKREPGFYWVLWKGEWIIAESNNPDIRKDYHWWITGEEGGLKDSDFIEIGPRIIRESPQKEEELIMLRTQHEAMRKDLIAYHGWENEPEIRPINHVVEMRILIKKVRESIAPKEEQPLSKEELIAKYSDSDPICETELFKKLKWDIGLIQFNLLAMSKDGKAIEANPATHAIAKEVYRLLAKEEQPELSGWVSVKDRLPEAGDEYNVVWEFEVGNPVVSTMEYNAQTKEWIDVSGFNSNCTNEVTHWMLLPDLPKEFARKKLRGN